MSSEREKKLQRRKHVVKELYDTETTYMEYLKVVILNFLQPMEKLSQDKPFLLEFSPVLFQNIIKLQDIHWQLYREMSKRFFSYSDDTKWCDVLNDTFMKVEFLEDYQVYINGYDQASVLVGNAQKAQSSSKNNFAYLGEFISKQLKTTKFGFASVSSFLIAPVQRLPRYMLFLKDLLNCTPEDHPDYPHVHDSFHTLDTVIKKINSRKGLYDRIYRVEELYRMFSDEDRCEIAEITDPIRELIGEGSIIEGKKNTKLRYIILFSDLFICSTKTGENSLTFEWKVDLSNSEIEIRKENEVEYIRAVSQKRISNYPFTLKETHELFATDDPSFSLNFWKEKFDIAQSSKKNLLFLFQNSNSVSMDMQNHLLSDVGDVDLFHDWTVVEYSKGDYLRKQGRKTKHLVIIKEGTCSVQIKVGNDIDVIGSMGPGQFIGEISYLSNEEDGEIATANVIADSDVIILEKSFKKLNQSLKTNSAIASKFFQLLCVILSNRFIRDNSSKSGWIKQTQNDFQPENFVNISNINISNKKKKRGDKSPRNRSKTVPNNNNNNLNKLEQIEQPRLANSGNLNPLNIPKRTGSNDNPVLPNSSPRVINSKLSATQDIILHQFHVTSKVQGTVGDLIISKGLIIFSAQKILGFTKKKNYSYYDIQKVSEEGENSNILRIYYKRNTKIGLKSDEYIMKNSNELQRAIKTISSFIKRRENHPDNNNNNNNNNNNDNDNHENEKNKDDGNFFTLSRKDWDRLLDTAQRLKIRKGTTIIEQGTIPSALYQLVSGKCGAFLLSVDGVNENAGTILEGEIFGELSFMLGLVSSATVVAEVDCVVMALNKSKLEMLLFNNPRISAALYRFIAKILRDRLVFNQTERKLSDSCGDIKELK